MEHIYDTIIIGGGPGGYTAALYAVRAGLDTVLLEKMYPGGQMTQTHQIDNYPGFEKGIDGFSLNFDFNFAYKDYKPIMEQYGLNGF